MSKCREISTSFVRILLLSGYLVSLSHCVLPGRPDLKPAIKAAETGRHQEAWVKLQQLADRFPDNPKVVLWLYKEAIYTKRIKAAQNYFQKAKNLGFTEDSLRSIGLQCWFEVAYGDMSRDRWQAAFKDLKQMNDLNKKDPRTEFVRQMVLGNDLYRQGKGKSLGHALLRFGAAAELIPSAGLPHFMLGRAYYRHNARNYELALEEYRLALAKEPDAPFASVARREIRAIKKRAQKARNFWNARP